MIKERQQSSTSHPMPFLLVLSSDHVTGATGLSPTVTIRKNGGSFAAASGAITEIAHGWYELAGDATDRDTIGELLIHATGTGTDPFDDRYQIVQYDPFDTFDSNTRVDVAKILGQSADFLFNLQSSSSVSASSSGDAAVDNLTTAINLIAAELVSIGAYQKPYFVLPSGSNGESKLVETQGYRQSLVFMMRDLVAIRPTLQEPFMFSWKGVMR